MADPIFQHFFFRISGYCRNSFSVIPLLNTNVGQFFFPTDFIMANNFIGFYFYFFLSLSSLFFNSLEKFKFFYDRNKERRRKFLTFFFFLILQCRNLFGMKPKCIKFLYCQCCCCMLYFCIHNTTQLETEKFKSYYITQGNKQTKKKQKKCCKKIEKIKPTSCEIILNIMLGIGAIFVRHCWYELKANIT